MNSASSPLRLAVFDCDGTLVDSQHGIIAAMERAWRGLALEPPPAAAVRRSVGLPLADAVAALAPDQDAAVHAALTEGYRDAYRQMHGGALLDEPLYPGAIEALDALDWSAFDPDADRIEQMILRPREPFVQTARSAMVPLSPIPEPRPVLLALVGLLGLALAAHRRYGGDA